MNELEQKRYILSGLVQTCFLAALLYPIWYYLDLVEIFGPSLDLRNVSPVNVEVAKQCAVIRLVVVLVLIVFIYFARHPLSPSVQSIKRLIYLGALAQQLFGQGIILLIWVLNKVTPDAFTGNYFAGLIMVFIVIAILTPWSPWLTMGQIAILSLSYVSAALMSGSDDMVRIMSNILFITGAGVLCCYGAFKTVEYRKETLPDTETSGRREPGDDDEYWVHRVIRRTLFILAIILFPVLAIVGMYYVSK